MSTQYRYRLNSTGNNSTSLGNCEVCGTHVSDVFLQVEQRSYTHPVSNAESWTHEGCHDYFGHEDCLKSKQR